MAADILMPFLLIIGFLDECMDTVEKLVASLQVSLAALQIRLGMTPL